MAYMFCFCGLFRLLQVYSHYVKPINGPNLWVKTGKGIVLPPNFKKQRGRPTKKRCREAAKYQDQTMKNKKLTKTGLVMKCSICGRQGHNKKSCYRQAGTSAGPPATEPGPGPSAATQTRSGPFTAPQARPGASAGTPPQYN